MTNELYPNHINELDNPRELNAQEKRIQTIDNLIEKIEAWHTIYEVALMNWNENRPYGNNPETHVSIAMDLENMLKTREIHIIKLKRQRERIIDGEEDDFEDDEELEIN